MQIKIKLPLQPIKKEKPFYDFWRDGITQSMLQSFLNDPYEAKLMYVDGWTTVESADFFIFGGIVHHVIEHILKEKIPPTSLLIRNLIGQYVLEEYLPKTLTTKQLSEIEKIAAKAEAVCKCYFIKYFSDFQRNWFCLETEFRLPYVYPDGKQTWLNGKIDLTELLPKSRLVLYDTKTYARWSKDAAMVLLPVDIQLNMYGYALTNLFPEMEVSQVNLNVIKKPTHQWTAKEKTVDDYVAKLEKAYKSDLDSYFIREPVSYSKKVASYWKETTLDPIMKRVREWVESNYTWPGYYNPCTLEGKYGLRPMTRMILDGDIMGYVKKPKPFPELNYNGL